MSSKESQMRFANSQDSSLELDFFHNLKYHSKPLITIIQIMYYFL